MTALTPDFLGQLFTVPEKDWTSVNKRVGEAAASADVTGYIAQYIPEFAVLLLVCDLWREQTFERLVKEAVAISRYAENAIEAYRKLNMIVGMISSGHEEITGEWKESVQRVISDLGCHVNSICQSVNLTDWQVFDFLEANRRADIQLSRYTEKLGFFWEPLGEVITEMKAASRLTAGQWNRMAHNLNQLNNSAVGLTLPFLIRLDIEASLVRCINLKSQADKFYLIARDQTKYWY